MISLEISLLGLALAMDAAVVSFALGLGHMGLSTKIRVERGLLLAFVFGFFQFCMLWTGSFGGYLFSFSSYGYLFQLVVATIFFLIALKFFQESISQEKRDLKWGLQHVFILGFATSIDALAAGVSLGTLPWARLAALEVGGITFVTCAFFYSLTQFLQHIPERWLLRFGCLIFSFLGGRIIWDYVSKGAL